MNDPSPSAILDAQAADLARLDDTTVCDVAGTAQAMDEMRAALDTLDDLLDARRLGEAGQLGYRDIASAFVFLQRMLGSLQTIDHDVSGLVSEVAGAMGCPYEEAEPHVLARLETMRPRPGSEAGQGAGATATLRTRGRVDLPGAVREHLNADAGATVRFELAPKGRVVVTLQDAGPMPGIRAEIREMVGQGDEVGAGTPKADPA